MPKTLVEIIDLIEETIPKELLWFVRSDPSTERYFANIILSPSGDAHSCYGDSPEEALTGAFAVWQSKQRVSP